MDWKNVFQDILKHQRNDTSNFLFAREQFFQKISVLVKGKINFNCGIEVAMSVLMRRKSLDSLQLIQLQYQEPLKQANLTDVDKLPNNHSGNDWRSIDDLNYYTTVQ